MPALRVQIPQVCTKSTCFEKDCVSPLETAMEDLKKASTQVAKDVEKDLKLGTKVVQEAKADMKKKVKTMKKVRIQVLDCE